MIAPTCHSTTFQHNESVRMYLVLLYSWLCTLHICMDFCNVTKVSRERRPSDPLTWSSLWINFWLSFAPHLLPFQPFPPPSLWTMPSFFFSFRLLFPPAIGGMPESSEWLDMSVVAFLSAALFQGGQVWRGGRDSWPMATEPRRIHLCPQNPPGLFPLEDLSFSGSLVSHATWSKHCLATQCFQFQAFIEGWQYMKERKTQEMPLAGLRLVEVHCNHLIQSS